MILFHFVSQNVSKPPRKTPSVNGFVIVYVSWKEIENFAKQISIYSNPNIILFALSTTDVSNEAR